MATGTLSTKYLRVGQPDGYTGQNVVRSRLFRKTATVDGTVNSLQYSGSDGSRSRLSRLFR